MDRPAICWALPCTLLLICGCGGSTIRYLRPKSDNAYLASLGLSGTDLSPAFAPGSVSYTAAAPLWQSSVTVTPRVQHALASVQVNGVAVASGASSAPIVLNLGQNTITVVVTAEDGFATQTYTVEVIRAMTVHQAYLKASNTGGSDEFGRSVAASGDLIVIGAAKEDSNATGVDGNQADNTAVASGAAYVFRRDGTVWAQEAYLKASNTGAGDAFGTSVAVSGDVIAVGAPGEDSTATGVNGTGADDGTRDDSGAVYVFEFDGSSWSQTAYVKAHNNDADDLFGVSVAASGDLVVVGAYCEDSNATGVDGDETDDTAPNAGAAYVFRRGLYGWTHEAYFKASNTGVDDWFGCSVAVSADVIVVGACYEDSSATGVNGTGTDDGAHDDSGAVYVFRHDGAAWAQEAYIKASNTGASDQFGFGVAVSGGVIVVGARGEGSNATGVNGNQTDDSQAFAGAAYVFRHDGTAWAQEAYLKASNTGAGDSFGDRVAVSGGCVVVGAGGEDSSATGFNGTGTDDGAHDQSGAAYVFRHDGTAWSHEGYLKASNTEATDFFGASVAVSGNCIVVGAYGEDSSATGVGGDQTDNTAPDAGAAYVIE